MIKNYVKIAVRNFQKYKIYSFINLIGLSFGILICIYIALYIHNEITYDAFHKDASRIYRVNSEMKFDKVIFSIPFTSYLLSETARESITDVETVTVWDRVREKVGIIKDGSTTFESGFSYSDNYFFTMFDFELIRGNKNTALSEPFTMVITTEMADKYFGSSDPVGSTLTVDLGDSTANFKITGIVEPAPFNSSIQFSFIASVASKYLREEYIVMRSWFNNSTLVFMKLSSPAKESVVTDQLNAAIENAIGDMKNHRVFLQPLDDIYLNRRGYNIMTLGDEQSIYLYGSLAILIMLIACINYINLATARSSTRDREVGLRRVLGARQRNLLRQFIFESVFYVFIAGMFAFLMAELLLDTYNNLLDMNLSLSIFLQPIYLAAVIGSLFVIGVLAGIYPALYLSRVRPVHLLKGSSRGKEGSIFRRILVVGQFSAAIVLFIGAGVIFDQLGMIQNKKLGFDKEHVIMVPLNNNDEVIDKTVVWKQELEKLPGVVSASMSELIYYDGSSNNMLQFEGMSDREGLNVNKMIVDKNLMKTMGYTMSMGDWFPETTDKGSERVYVVNQAFVEQYDIDNPVGMYIRLNHREGRIIGVVKDFHYKPLRSAIEPLVFAPMIVGEKYWRDYAEIVLIRLQAGSIGKGVDEVEESWQAAFPGKPFEYEFIDEVVDKSYRSEKQIANIVVAFGIFGIFIACLGLYGLSAYSAERRKKEIGIRKVLGASIENILVKMTSEFLLLLLIAFIIAYPAGYYITNQWLQDFAYRVTPSWQLYVLAGLTVIIIAIVTVSVQAIRTANSNPVDAIKHE